MRCRWPQRWRAGASSQVRRARKPLYRRFARRQSIAPTAHRNRKTIGCHFCSGRCERNALLGSRCGSGLRCQRRTPWCELSWSFTRGVRRCRQWRRYRWRCGGILCGRMSALAGYFGCEVVYWPQGDSWRIPKSEFCAPNAAAMSAPHQAGARYPCVPRYVYARPPIQWPKWSDVKRAHGPARAHACRSAS